MTTKTQRKSSGPAEGPKVPTFPKYEDASKKTQATVDKIIDALNTPRKCFGFFSPNAVLPLELLDVLDACEGAAARLNVLGGRKKSICLTEDTVELSRVLLPTDIDWLACELLPNVMYDFWCVQFSPVRRQIYHRTAANILKAQDRWLGSLDLLCITPDGEELNSPNLALHTTELDAAVMSGRKACVREAILLLLPLIQHSAEAVVPHNLLETLLRAEKAYLQQRTKAKKEEEPQAVVAVAEKIPETLPDHTDGEY